MIKEIFKSKGTRYIISGWVFFISENIILSHNKNELIETFGEDIYYRLYNVLSTCACGGLAYSWFFYGRKTGPVVFRKLNLTSNILGFSLQALGLIGISQILPPFQIPVSFNSNDKTNDPDTHSMINSSFFTLNIRCPIDLKAHRNNMNKDNNNCVYGIERVTRHAALWSLGHDRIISPNSIYISVFSLLIFWPGYNIIIGIFFLGSAVSTIYVTEIAMGMGPIIFSAIGTVHQDYRRKNLGHSPILTKEMEDKTSNIPFAALLGGRQSWKSLTDEMKW